MVSLSKDDCVSLVVYWYFIVLSIVCYEAKQFSRVVFYYNGSFYDEAGGDYSL